MFGRLLWKLLRSNRGRLAVALVAVISGATVISALLNVELELNRKLTREFRLLGPNIVISGKSIDQPTGEKPRISAVDSTVLDLDLGAPDPLATDRSVQLFGSASFLYFVANVSGRPVVTAGTQLEQLPKLNPTWGIEGSWVDKHSDASQCLIGRHVARQFGLAPGGQIELDYLGRSLALHVSGVIDSGGPDDDHIFMSLPLAWSLAGNPGLVSVWELNVSGSGEAISKYAEKVAARLPQYDVRPVRAVTLAEGNLLHRTQLLIVSMIVLILALTALCVLATMAALATERRADVGLMKALGGTIARIVGLFLAELGVLGAAGGVIGCAAGVALAEWIGRRVFGAAISPRWEIFPLTIALMILVAMAGALPLQRLGKVKPAVILRGE
jgi:putative ABC transport system permease protein